ncbi:hypothetical protein HOB10_04610 [Candidatus Parcubacteria bacterium]|jgi:hypothetical protein|nr:hypothetical protein [Candidatus Parcubacteria bacterium]
MNKKIILMTTILAMVGLLFVNLVEARQYVGRYSTIFDLDGGGDIDLTDISLIASYLQTSNNDACFNQYEPFLTSAFMESDSWCSSLLGITGATLRSGEYDAVADLNDDGIVNISDLALIATYYGNDYGQVCMAQIANNYSMEGTPWCDGIYQGIADTIGEADGGPDLSPETITISPEEPIVWTETEITVQVRNTGTTSFTDQSTINDFYRMLGNFEVEQEILPEVSTSNPIEPGETYEVIFRGKYTRLGNQHLSFVVDPQDNLDELNEYNNSITARVSASASSDIDLSVEDINFESDNNLPNETGVLSVTLKNNGEAITSSLGVYSISNNFANKGFVFSGGSNNYTVDRDNKHITGSFPFHAGDTLTMSWQGHFASEGNKSLQCDADRYNHLAETNELNNSLTKVIVISSNQTTLPDYPVCDHNGDGLYNLSDVALFAGCQNTFDANGDGVHNLTDLSLYASNYSDAAWCATNLPECAPEEADEMPEHTTCDHNSDGLYNLADISLFASCMDTFDANDDGVHNLTDLSLYASNHNDQDWCEQYLPECASEDDTDDNSDYLTIVKTRVDQITQTSARVYWQASMGSMGEYRYATSTQGLASASSWSNGIDNHPDQTGNMFASMVTLNNLESNTKYYIELKKFYMDGPNYVYGDPKIITFVTLGEDDEGPEEKITICHTTGSGKNQTLSVAESAWVAHQRHGDTRGACEEIDLPPVIVKPPTIVDSSLVGRVRGRILLQVENNGEAWYVRPSNGKKVYMKDGGAAYGMMRNLGLGITNANLKKIPVGVEDRFESRDTDGDGLPDKLEEGLGTDPNNPDTDGDGHNDRTEVLNGYNPLGTGQMTYDSNLVNGILGKIVLQVESRGEAWYINPVDGKRYYMKDGPAAYQIMRYLSLGITNKDLNSIDTE